MGVEENLKEVGRVLLSIGYTYNGRNELLEADEWVKDVEDEYMGKLNYIHTIYISDKLEQVEVEN